MADSSTEQGTYKISQEQLTVPEIKEVHTHRKKGESPIAMELWALSKGPKTQLKEFYWPNLKQSEQQNE